MLVRLDRNFFACKKKVRKRKRKRKRKSGRSGGTISCILLSHPPLGGGGGNEVSYVPTLASRGRESSRNWRASARGRSALHLVMPNWLLSEGGTRRKRHPTGETEAWQLRVTTSATAERD